LEHIKLAWANGAGWLALVLCALIAYHLRADPSSGELIYGAWLLPLALLLVALAFGFNGGAVFIQPFALAVAPFPHLDSRRRRWIGVALGLVAIATLSAINTGYLPLVHLQVQFGLLLVGIAALVWGFSGGGTNRTAREWQWEQTVLIGVTLFAFALRINQIETLVPNFVDEMLFAQGIGHVRDVGGYDALLMPFNENAAFPRLYPYLQALNTDILGRNHLALRLLSACLGTLTIPAVYHLGRQLFDRPTALVGALLLATFPPHLAFSRIGLNNIADPLFGVLALALLLRGWRRGRLIDYVLAGVMLGLTQYFYEVGRLLFPALIGVSIIWFGWGLRRLLWHYLRLGSVALLVGLPIYLTLIRNEFPLAARAADRTIDVRGFLFGLAVGDWQAIGPQALNPFLVYVHLPEPARYYGGDQPMILPWLVPFFLLGLMTLLIHPRRPAFLLVPWLLIVVLGNMLVKFNVSYPRYVATFPAVALMIAVGLRAAVGLLVAHRGAGRLIRRFKSQIPVHGLPLLVVAGLLALIQLIYYFGPHQEAYRRQLYADLLDVEGVVRRSLDYPAGWPIYVLDAVDNEPYFHWLLDYFSDERQLYFYPAKMFLDDVLPVLPTDKAYLFYTRPDDELVRQALAARFALQGPYLGPDNVPVERQYWLVVVAPANAAG
jgi:hypothetical protein